MATKKQAKSFPKWLILGVIFVVLAALLWKPYWNAHSNNTQSSTSTNEMANWKTYTNNQEKYSIKYPGDWKINQYVTSDRYIEFRNEELYTTPPPLDFVTFTVAVLDPKALYNHPPLSEEEFYNLENAYWSNQNDTYDAYAYDSKKIVDVAGNKSVEGIYHFTSNYVAFKSTNPSNKTYSYGIFKDEKIFFINFDIDDKNPKKEEMLKLKDQILSTFKFTK